VNKAAKKLKPKVIEANIILLVNNMVIGRAIAAIHLRYPIQAQHLAEKLVCLKRLLTNNREISRMVLARSTEES
jgi:hypothetical protein